MSSGAGLAWPAAVAAPPTPHSDDYSRCCSGRCAQQPDSSLTHSERVTHTLTPNPTARSRCHSTWSPAAGPSCKRGCTRCARVQCRWRGWAPVAGGRLGRRDCVDARVDTQSSAPARLTRRRTPTPGGPVLRRAQGAARLLRGLPPPGLHRARALGRLGAGALGRCAGWALHGLQQRAAGRPACGGLHPHPEAPHPTCWLRQWNGTEKTFDCPCHGSHFDRFGKCINVSTGGGPPLQGYAQEPLAEGRRAPLRSRCPHTHTHRALPRETCSPSPTGERRPPASRLLAQPLPVVCRVLQTPRRYRWGRW